jgi:hypothetical protein
MGLRATKWSTSNPWTRSRARALARAIRFSWQPCCFASDTGMRLLLRAAYFGGGLKARKNGRLNAALGGPEERLIVSNGEKRRPALQQRKESPIGVGLRATQLISSHRSFMTALDDPKEPVAAFWPTGRST